MAVTNLTSGGSGSSASSYATASIAPAANAMVIVAVASSIASSAAPTVMGASGTWVQIGTKVDAAGSRRVTLFRDLSASPGSGALTIDFGGVTQTNCNWSIDQFTGVDTSGTHGSGAIVQTQSNTSSGTSTGITVTLNALAHSGNLAYGYIRNNVTLPDKGAAFTQLSTNNAAGQCEAEWAADQTAVAWTWASTSLESAAIAVEIGLLAAAQALATANSLTHVGGFWRRNFSKPKKAAHRK